MHAQSLQPAYHFHILLILQHFRAQLLLTCDAAIAHHT